MHYLLNRAINTLACNPPGVDVAIKVEGGLQLQASLLLTPAPPIPGGAGAVIHPYTIPPIEAPPGAPLLTRHSP